MSGFSYLNGVRHCESVPLPALAAAAGTPCYVYSAGRMRANARRLQQTLPEASLCFAVKANSNIAILKLMASLGLGADIVSGGELLRAQAAGIAPEKIVFSGVGKTATELQAALQAGIHQINVESVEELQILGPLSAQHGGVQAIALRINPDVAASTNSKIATGRKGDKFGIELEQVPAALAELARWPNLKLVGLAVHIGSQLFIAQEFAAAFTVLAELTRSLRAQGHALNRLDLGGGMGVPYRPNQAVFDTAGYAQSVRTILGPLGCALTLEPGRYLVADAGVLLSQVVLTKRGTQDRFVILDAAMNDLIRPALYEAYHAIVPVQEPTQEGLTTSVVGPVCESGDCFGETYTLPALARGDLVTLETAGAYGAAMSSTYNTRPLCAEVLVDGSQWHIIRPAIPAAAQIAGESLPEWL